MKERKAMKKISLDYVRVTEQEPTFLASLKSFVKDAVQYLKNIVLIKFYL